MTPVNMLERVGETSKDMEAELRYLMFRMTPVNMLERVGQTTRDMEAGLKYLRSQLDDPAK